MKELERKDADGFVPEVVFRPAQLDYPGMFSMVAQRPVEGYYLAPDQKTALEGTIDLARTLLLKPAVEGEEFLLTDDAGRTVYAYEVTSGGNYTSGSAAAHRGQYGALRDKKQIVWTVEDKLYGFLEGELVASYRIPKDVYGIVGCQDETYLVGRNRIYRIKSLETQHQA